MAVNAPQLIDATKTAENAGKSAKKVFRQKISVGGSRDIAKQLAPAEMRQLTVSPIFSLPLQGRLLPYSHRTGIHAVALFLAEGTMSEVEQQLFDLLRERCYQEGDFTLSSGEKSKYYFDAKNLFMSSVGTFLIGKSLYEKTKDLDIQAIGGLEVGAIPLTSAAVVEYHRNDRKMEGFFVRNEAKKHGTKKVIEGTLKSGWRVAIVDDVATKGGSIMKAVDAMRRAECVPVLITVLVDRQEGAAQLFAKEGIPFQPLFTIEQFRRKS